MAEPGSIFKLKLKYVSVKPPSFASHTTWVHVHEEEVLIVDEKGVGKGRSGIDTK